MKTIQFARPFCPCYDCRLALRRARRRRLLRAIGAGVGNVLLLLLWAALIFCALLFCSALEPGAAPAPPLF